MCHVRYCQEISCQGLLLYGVPEEEGLRNVVRVNNYQNNGKRPNVFQ